MKVNYLICRFISSYPNNNSGDSKEYIFLSNLPLEDVRVGDHVIVETQYGLSIAEVSRLTTTSAERRAATRWAFQFVDTSALDKVKVAYERVVQIREQLREAREQYDDLKFYEVIAKDNPQIASLLTELKALDCGDK